MMLAGNSTTTFLADALGNSAGDGDAKTVTTKVHKESKSSKTLQAKSRSAVPVHLYAGLLTASYWLLGHARWHLYVG